LAKIAFLGNFEVTYSSENHHAKSLESLGHTVKKMQEKKIRSEDILHIASKSDLFVWVHTHGWQTAGNLIWMMFSVGSRRLAYQPLHTI
jgi:hypothetical protein